MSDVFISYARDDQHLAETLSHCIETQGWSVWWDRTIPAGRTFDDVIEEAIDAAKCVIVLWSKRSVTSEWVRIEAQEGADRKILIPVLIEDVRIPLAFRRIQAANLIGWDGAITASSFQKLIDDITTLLGPSQKEEVTKQQTGARVHKTEEERKKRQAEEETERERKTEAERKAEEEPKRKEEAAQSKAEDYQERREAERKAEEEGEQKEVNGKAEEEERKRADVEAANKVGGEHKQKEAKELAERTKEEIKHKTIKNESAGIDPSEAISHPKKEVTNKKRQFYIICTFALAVVGFLAGVVWWGLLLRTLMGAIPIICSALIIFSAIKLGTKGHEHRKNLHITIIVISTIFGLLTGVMWWGFLLRTIMGAIPIICGAVIAFLLFQLAKSNSSSG